jgi:hypothetical protein
MSRRPLLLLCLLLIVTSQLALAAPAMAKNTPWRKLPASVACEKAQAYLDEHPQGKHAREARRFIAKHCHQAPEPEAINILSVTSDAPCTVTITGEGIADYSMINMDFDSLLELPDGVYLTYLRVYQPGSDQNLATTQVTVDASGEVQRIDIYDPATCGRSMIVTSILDADGANGTAWYETVQVMA